jgi:prepilin-type N-terminal cleavage/methylation domain-containing protein
MKHILREKKGMTLVELIFAILIAAIVIVLSGGYLVSSLGLFSSVANRGMDAASADSILSLVTDQLNFAEAVNCVPAGDFGAASTTSGGILLYVGNETGTPASAGYLWMKRDGDTNRVNVFGSAFYHGGSLDMQYKVDSVAENGRKAVTISLNIIDKYGEKTMPRAKTVRLLNAKPYDPTAVPLVADKSPLAADVGVTYPAAGAPLILQIEVPS